jgi:hypothetical protein
MFLDLPEPILIEIFLALSEDVGIKKAMLTWTKVGIQLFSYFFFFVIFI